MHLGIGFMPLHQVVARSEDPRRTADTLPSSAPVARRAPSGLNAIARIIPECP